VAGDLDVPGGRLDLVAHSGRDHGRGASGQLQRRRIAAVELRRGAEEEAGVSARYEEDQGFLVRRLPRAPPPALQPDPLRAEPRHRADRHELAAREAPPWKGTPLLARQEDFVAGRGGRHVAQEAQRRLPAEGFRDRRPFVLIVQPVDHVRGDRGELFESAADHRVDDADPLEAEDVSRQERDPPSLVTRVGRAVQPAREGVLFIRGVPLVERADQRERAGPGVEHVKDLDLVDAVLLEAETLPRLLEEDRIAERAARLDRIALVFRQQADVALEGGDPTRLASRERSGQKLAQGALPRVLEALQARDRHVGRERLAERFELLQRGVHGCPLLRLSRHDGAGF